MATDRLLEDATKPPLSCRRPGPSQLDAERAGQAARWAAAALLATRRATAVVLAPLIAFASCWTWYGHCQAVERFEFRRPQMGTEFRLVFHADDAEQADRAAEAAFVRIERIDAALSHYRPESELSRLGARSSEGAPTEAIAVGDDLWTVLVAADRISQISHGAFDITVGPYVRLWKRSAAQQALPTAARLAEARGRVGFEKLQLDCRLRSVRLLARGMQLDLGGIAKGFAVDEALAVLKNQGISAALVDGGGDIAVGDPPAGRGDWRIGLPDPRHPQSLQTIGLSARAVATSGADYRYVTIGDRRYSHIIDPATGLGVTHGLTVSVVASDCMTADALASAVSVLGISRGLQLVASIPGAEVRITDRSEPAATVLVSPGFPPIESAANRPEAGSAAGELPSAGTSNRIGGLREGLE